MRARRIPGPCPACCIRGAAQAAYPEKPVRFVVPSAPGGSVDVLMRILTQQLSAQMGVAFVVENKPGASFVPGDDGHREGGAGRYTLGYGNIVSLAVNRTLLPALAVRRGKGPHAGVELRAGVQHARGEQRPAGAHGGGADRLREEEPGKLSNGSSGNGHDGAPGRRALQGDDRDGDVHVPYKGSAQAIKRSRPAISR